MTDLEACQAAFPALTWARSAFLEATGTAPNMVVVVHVYATGGAQAFAAKKRHRHVRPYAEGLGSSVPKALTALRQALAVVRDDLTAALGDKE